MTDDYQLHVLIADDEQYVREHLRDLLSSRSEVGGVTEAHHGREAVEVIEAEGPDLVFLDVKMPTMSGLDVIEELGPDAMPATVFVTAHDEFAIEAFDLAAVDYLLKPFDEDRFSRAFERGLRALKLTHVEAWTDRFQGLLDLYGELRTGANGTQKNGSQEENGEYLERITVEERNQIHVVPVEDIRYVTAEDTYVKLHTVDDSYLLRERMYEMEQCLDPAQFARIHRSTIVRLDCIECLVQRSENDYFVQLDDAKRFRVSRSRQDDLLQRLKTGAVT
ncbi:MAG: LytR/AlgR family response regulator transcription factor [Salinibacter sp.]